MGPIPVTQAPQSIQDLSTQLWEAWAGLLPNQDLSTQLWKVWDWVTGLYYNRVHI